MEGFWKLITLGIPENIRTPLVNILWRFGVTIALMMAYGLATVTGFPGFARADDVAALKRAQLDATAEVLAQNIFDTRVRQCGATSPEARHFYAERLQGLVDRYFNLMQRVYAPIPACGEL